MLSVFCLGNEETAPLKRLSEMSWSWPGVITLLVVLIHEKQVRADQRRPGS